MPVNLDTYLGVHADALKVFSKRNEVLADNLANADTPNFKARDIDFRAALASAGSPGSTLPMTPANASAAAPNIGTAASASATTGANAGAAGATISPAEMKYRVPLAPSLDGNTVDTQLEQAQFAQNTVRYQATLTFLSDKFRGLMTAITGQ